MNKTCKTSLFRKYAIHSGKVLDNDFMRFNSVAVLSERQECGKGKKDFSSGFDYSEKRLPDNNIIAISV